MTDPFDALRIADAPLDPRPDFAAELRRTITTALENTMTVTEPEVNADVTRVAVPEPPAQSITAYISVRNATAAIAFYIEAFGAVELSRLVGDDGRIGHAEITIGNSKMMLADEYPEIDSLGPESRGGPSCLFVLEVPDVDDSFQRAVAAGATVTRPIADEPYGRMGQVTDPFGHRWMLSTPPSAGLDRAEYARISKDEGYELIEGRQLKHHNEGDLYYFTLPVHDLSRAQAFFTAVLGWQFPDPQQGHIANISAPPGGIAQVSGDASTRAQLWFVVDDIHAAVAKVRELGGSATDPVNYDSGWSADCVDDQGTTFNLSVPAAKYTQ
jgi:uncharacterized glyoxalase superfamily protein PhnB